MGGMTGNNNTIHQGKERIQIQSCLRKSPGQCWIWAFFVCLVGFMLGIESKVLCVGAMVLDRYTFLFSS